MPDGQIFDKWKKAQGFLSDDDTILWRKNGWVNTKQVVAVWPTLEMTYILFWKKNYNLIVGDSDGSNVTRPKTLVLEVQWINVILILFAQCRNLEGMQIATALQKFERIIFSTTYICMPKYCPKTKKSPPQLQPR